MPGGVGDGKALSASPTSTRRTKIGELYDVDLPSPPSLTPEVRSKSINLIPSENPLVGRNTLAASPGSESKWDGKLSPKEPSPVSQFAALSGDIYSPNPKRNSVILRNKKAGKSAKLHSSVYSKKQIKAALKIQKWYRSMRFSNAVQTAVFCNKRRRAILKEIYATEESYVTSLTVLSAEFMERLGMFFSETELQNVFVGVKELLNIHRDFLGNLKHQVPSFSSATAVNTGMAQLFLQFVPQFEEPYTKFLTNQEKSRRMVEGYCFKNKELVREMDKIVDKNGSQRGRQFFDSLMTTPMQRLPRYQLLLKEYQKVTNMMYHDMVDVSKAIHLIAQVTLVVNENKRDHDELRMREMLERNSSMEVLECHQFEEMAFAAMRNCIECEKSVWGLTKSGWKCTECGAVFHNHCMKLISGQRRCPRRKKLDFSLKKLSYLQEVDVIPFNPNLHVAPTSNTSSTSLKPIANDSYNNGKSPRRSLNFKESPVVLHGDIDRKSLANSTPNVNSSPSNPPNNVAVASQPQGRRKRVARSKAVLCFFDDGLGIAHIRSDETGTDKFDFMGDLPWAILDECCTSDVKEQEDEWVFAVKARFQEWRFALPTKTEQEAIVMKLNEARIRGTTKKRAQTSGPSLNTIIKK